MKFSTRTDALLRMTRRQLSHAVLPGLAFVAIAALFAMTDLDRTLAHAWAFDATLGVFPARGAWWSTNLVHDGGRHLVWAIWFATIGTYVASFVIDDWRAYRRPALFTFVAIALATLAVNVLKALSNVDCPWDLIDFGGALPYVPFFADRPNALPSAACFPGSHSSSGFALVAFYFALQERWPRAARVALLSALAVGAVFAFGARSPRRAFSVPRSVERLHRLVRGAWALLAQLRRTAVAPSSAIALPVLRASGVRTRHTRRRTRRTRAPGCVE